MLKYNIFYGLYYLHCSACTEGSLMLQFYVKSVKSLFWGFTAWKN